MNEEQEKQQLELLKKQLLTKIFTKDARERLNRVRLAHPQIAEQIELSLLPAAQAGHIQEKIDDQKLKNILKRIQEEKRSFNIKKWDQ
jgi:programmed cell death protein 5